METGAAVRVLEPAPDEYLVELAEKGRISLHAEFGPELLAGAALVFVATPDREQNGEIARAARERGIWVNSAENPGEGDFHLPATIGRGDFRLAVSTGGGGPALAAVAAERLRGLFGPEYGRLAALLAEIRPDILIRVADEAERRAIFRKLAASAELLAFLASSSPRAADCVKKLLPPGLLDGARLEQLTSNALNKGENVMCGNAH
jgi:precorrin-2 dehydrogenase/sirohydrochlorin ferrochelatase